MQITELSVKRVRDGSGNIVSVSAFFPANEELDADNTARLLDMLREAAGGDVVSRDTNDDHPHPYKSKAEREAEKPDPQSAPETTTRRRRGTSEASDAPAETAPSAPKEAATPAPEQAGGRRRRAVTQEAPAEDRGNADTAGASGDQSSPRRRRASTAAEPAGTTGSNSAPTAAAKSLSKLKDADMSKAASAAAMKIGSEAVMLLVGEYVEGANPKVNQIPDEDRAEFVAKLDALVEKYG